MKIHTRLVGGHPLLLLTFVLSILSLFQVPEVNIVNCTLVVPYHVDVHKIGINGSCDGVLV